MLAHIVVNYSETKVHQIDSRSQKIFSTDKLLYYYTITNILRLSIYTSMNHPLPFKPRGLALQNI